MSQDIKLIQVFAGTAIEAGMVQSMLESAGIESFLKDENIGTLAPWQVAGGGVGAVKVLVSSADYEQAAAVINEYNKNEIE